MTPEEIRGRRFLVTVPGYDLDEVQGFLEEVATLVEEGPAVPRAERFADIGQAARQVLEAADAAAAELRAHGERDAERLEAEARARANEILREAEADQLEVDRSRRQLEEERRELAHLQQQVIGAIRRAGDDTQAMLLEAGDRRRVLLEAIEEVRTRLGDGFTAAREHVDRTYDRVEELAFEVEFELEVGEPLSASSDEATTEPEAAEDIEPADDVERQPAEGEAQDDDAVGVVRDSPSAADAGEADAGDTPVNPPPPEGAQPNDDEAFYAALASRIRETTQR